MKSLIAAIVVALLATFGIATAEPAHPWEKAQAVLDATNTAVANGGSYAAIGERLTELEEALAGADAAFAATAGENGVSYVLTDGPQDTLFSLAAAAAAHEKQNGNAGGQTVAVANPYPAIALFLGSYYNEIGKPEEALRVLDKGLALYTTHGIEFGSHRGGLTSERAVALVQMKRFGEALAGYEDGLKLAELDDWTKARLLRGRGYCLTELERLDEAEAAYRESLKLEPGNKTALGELDYIAKLKAGGAKAPSAGIKQVDPPPTKTN
jgi:tetratricopeptide (TPR) repeat protein